MQNNEYEKVLHPINKIMFAPWEFEGKKKEKKKKKKGKRKEKVKKNKKIN